MALYLPLLCRLHPLTPTRWEVFSFALPLVQGGYRRGLVLCAQQPDKTPRWAEISPLPERSKETLEEAGASLLAFLHTPLLKTSAQSFLRIHSALNQEDLLTQEVASNKQPPFGISRQDSLPPSVQFGLESLFFSSFLPVAASLQALLYGSKEEILLQAQRARALGFTTVKVKTHLLAISEIPDLLRFLRATFRLRVDCNSAFSFQEALHLFESFPPSFFDYIEDPSYERVQLTHFPHPFALDAHVSIDDLHLVPYDHFYGFVLKPTVVGGSEACIPFVNYALHHQRRIILSSALESGVGLFQILRLAQHWNLSSSPLGLDTLQLFQHDLLSVPLFTRSPHLLISHEPQPQRSLLHRIAHGYTDLPSF